MYVAGFYSDLLLNGVAYGKCKNLTVVVQQTVIMSLSVKDKHTH